MDVLSIRTFMSVKETGSFSRAGERLLLTQPAVSKRIAALEMELGTRLFDRVGKKVILTEAGRELSVRSQKIIMELEDCKRAISNLSEKVSGRLCFATSHHIGLHRLPSVLSRFHIEYPEVELDIRFMDSEEGCAAVIRGDVELALVTLPNTSRDGLCAESVWQDDLIPVVGAGHSLSKGVSGSSIAILPEQLALNPAILPGPGTYTRELITREFADVGVEIMEKLSTNNLETIKMLITVGMGWGVLPQSMVKDSELYSLQVNGVNMQRTLGIMYHPHRTLSNSAREMIMMIGEV